MLVEIHYHSIERNTEINKTAIHKTDQKKRILAIFFAGLPITIGLLLTYFIVTGNFPTVQQAEKYNDNSSEPVISADGRYVAFASCDAGFVGDNAPKCGEANCEQVFRKDMDTGALVIVSVNAAGESGDGHSGSNTAEITAISISADGRFVAFASRASNLIADMTLERPEKNSYANTNIYLKDLESGAISIVSTDASGRPHEGRSGYPALSADGRFLAFWSTAKTLVPGSRDIGDFDVFRKDLQTGDIIRVSTDQTGLPIWRSGEPYVSPAISADGRYISFRSNRFNPDTKQRIEAERLFVKDTQNGAISMASANAAGAAADDDSYEYSMSDDGRYVAFRSNAINLVPGVKCSSQSPMCGIIYVKDMRTGAIVAVTGEEASDPAISGDGRYLAFSSTLSELMPGGLPESCSKSAFGSCMEVYWTDMQTGDLQRASSISGEAANAQSMKPAISRDGQYVAFISAADNLVPGSIKKCQMYRSDSGCEDVDLVSCDQVFIWDHVSNRVQQVSTAMLVTP